MAPFYDWNAAQASRTENVLSNLQCLLPYSVAGSQPAGQYRDATLLTQLSLLAVTKILQRSLVLQRVGQVLGDDILAGFSVTDAEFLKKKKKDERKRLTWHLDDVDHFILALLKAVSE